MCPCLGFYVCGAAVIPQSSWHDRCVSLAWLMTSWRPQRALVMEDKPSEWCRGAEDSSASGGGLSAACLQKSFLKPACEYEGWHNQQACPVRYLWPFKVPLCLSAHLVTNGLADRSPLQHQHWFNTFICFFISGGLHHTAGPEARQLRTRQASAHLQQTARQEKTGTSHTQWGNYLTAGLFCSTT